MADQQYRTKDGDVLDWICFQQYGDEHPYVEAVLVANPGLADYGPFLPPGLLISLPAFAPAKAPQAQIVHLWS